MAPLDWSRKEDLVALRQDDGGIDTVLACDCIFPPVYGSAWPLLETATVRAVQVVVLLGSKRSR